jgi:c-di-GMP-binding flagellar brake protein YcgR
MTAPSRKTIPEPIDRRRRRHPRYRADFQVVANYLAGNQYKKFEGHCNDLSESGLGMLLATDISNGEVVGLNFSLPGSAFGWQLRAVVRYRRGYHYGFEFLSLTAEQRDSLKTYLGGLQPAD